MTLSKNIIRLCEAKEIFWHGTTSVFARKILKTGFNPAEIKNKVWDSETEGKESFEGSYFTQNIVTASGSAGNARRKFGGISTFIEVQLETRDSLYDEDVLPKMVSVVDASWSHWTRKTFGNANNLTSTSAQGILDVMAIKEEDRESYHLTDEQIDSFFRYCEDFWIRQLSAEYNQFPGKAKLSIETIKSIRPLLRKQVVEALKIHTKSNYLNPNDMKAWVGEYRELSKQIVDKLRGMPSQIRSDFLNHVRSDKIVGFKGANRILSIIVRPSDVAYSLKEWEGEWPGLICVYGTPSDKFIEQYNKNISGNTRWEKGTFKKAEELFRMAQEKDKFNREQIAKKNEGMATRTPRMGSTVLRFKDGAQWLKTENRGLDVYTLRMPREESFSSILRVYVDSERKIQAVSDPVLVTHQKYLIALLINDVIQGFRDDYRSNFSLTDLGHNGRNLIRQYPKFRR